MATTTVTTTAAQVATSGWTDIQNLGAVDVYIGTTSAVTSSNGIKIAAGASYSRPTGGRSAPLYAIAASSTADLRWEDFG